MSHLAGLLDGSPDSSIRSILDKCGFIPSGKRATSTIADKIVSCVQPAKRVAPMLIPEGLGPTAHLNVAFSVQHPFARTPALCDLAEEVLELQHKCPLDLVEHRCTVVELISQLESDLKLEWESWLPFIDSRIRPIVALRNVAFCREISFVTSFSDPLLWPSYVLGLRMIGWAEKSSTLPVKVTVPSCDEHKRT